MTKEEKIKEVCDEKYHKMHIEIKKYALSNDGFIPKDTFISFLGISEWSNSESKRIGGYIHCRPKSLQDIENNNGWIKIESEEDLPKELYIKTNIIKDNKTYMYCDYRGNNIWWNYEYKMLIENATHYQPIEKPKPPIY